MRHDDRWARGLRGDGRIDPRDPGLAALALVTGCLVLALLALGAAPASAAIRVTGPAEAGAGRGFEINRGMAGIALGETTAAVRELLGAPARTDAGPDFVAWSYRRPPIEVTFKPAVVTLHTTSDRMRGPRSIGVGTSERRLRAVLGRRLRCRAPQGLCMVGSFATGRRSTVFAMKRRRVASVTISLSTR